MEGLKKMPSNYFVLVHPGLTLFISTGLVLMAMTWLCPEVFSSPYLGLMGQFLLWLGTQHNTFIGLTFLPVMTIHVIEAVVTVYLCVRHHLTPTTTTLWTTQVLLVGFLSLRFLIWPQKDVGKAAEREKHE